MSLEQSSLFGPLVRFLKSLPVLTVTLIAIPFVAPQLTRYFVEPLLPTDNFVSRKSSRGKKNLEIQNAQLLQENQHLKDLLTKLKALNMEEQAIKPLMVARNLGTPPQRFRRSLVLSFKKNDHEIDGAPVVIENKLVGLIDAVHDNWCQVQLVSDPEFKLAVEIVSHKDNKPPTEGWPRGIVGGQIVESGGSAVIVRYIDNSRLKDIKPGDYVMTSGFDFKVQKGLIIGRVKDVVKRDLFLHIPVTLDGNPRENALFSILSPVPNPFLKSDSES